MYPLTRNCAASVKGSRKLYP